MSDRRDKKSKRRRRDRDNDDDPGISRGSGVNYSKVADRHIDDDRFEKHRKSGPAPSSTADAGPAAAAAGTSAASQPKVSSQMTAVMRLMAGMEERTISEKLADSNRPTWEQYKKDNEDKLDIAGVDSKKMEAYRKELDEQRDKLLNKGKNHRSEKDDKKSKKKKNKKHRRHDDSYSSESDSDDSSGSERRSHKRKKHKKRSSKHKKSSRRYDSDSYDSGDDRKKSSKHKKKKDKKRKKGDDGSSSSGDGYRLSSFFTKGSDDESR